MLPTLYAQFIATLCWIFVPNVYSQSTDCGYVPQVLQNTYSEEGWPWLVSITMKVNNPYFPWCNGVLLDRRHVLTAAHCFDSEYRPYANRTHSSSSDLLVRVGNMYRMVPQEYKVACITKHDRYESYTAASYDDIAILTLSRNVDTPNYTPICLPDESIRIKNLSGIEVTKTFTMDVNFTQKKVHIISNRDCSKAYKRWSPAFSRLFPGDISGDTLCAENPIDQREPCKTGGAPLMYKDENNKWIIVGISSSGYTCVAGMPHIYTRVSAYLDWIEENTGYEKLYCS